MSARGIAFLRAMVCALVTVPGRDGVVRIPQFRPKRALHLEHGYSPVVPRALGGTYSVISGQLGVSVEQLVQVEFRHLIE